jgi:uncharacterized membrane protein YadS
VLFNSLGLMSDVVQGALSDASKALLTMDIAALGLRSSFGQLAQTGWRPFALVTAATARLAVVVLACLSLFVR